MHAIDLLHIFPPPHRVIFIKIRWNMRNPVIFRTNNMPLMTRMLQSINNKSLRLKNIVNKDDEINYKMRDFLINLTLYKIEMCVCLCALTFFCTSFFTFFNRLIGQRIRILNLFRGILVIGVNFIRLYLFMCGIKYPYH